MYLLVLLAFLWPKWKIFLPFHQELVKSLPFRIPYEAWKRYPFRAEPPRLESILPNPPPPPGVPHNFHSKVNNSWITLFRPFLLAQRLSIPFGLSIHLFVIVIQASWAKVTSPSRLLSQKLASTPIVFNRFSLSKGWKWTCFIRIGFELF